MARRHRQTRPDTLKLALDKTGARAGDVIHVNIEARYPGKATLQVVGDRLLAEQAVDVPEGGISVPLTVGENWGTGAYVLGTLFTPMDVKAKRMPARAIGVAWFGIDRAARTLAVQLTPPAMMKPRQRLTVPVKIEGFAPGEDVYLTVAAVDVGILNLTRYKPPAPDSHYFDQKRLSAELRDIYSVLIDGMQGERGKLRSGGDADARFRGAAADAEAAQPVFRHREDRRRRHDERRFRHTGFQRHGAGDGGRLVEGQGRPCGRAT